MKAFKYIILTGVIFSLVSFFSLAGVTAMESTNDYYSGKKAGIAQVQSENKFPQCGWPTRSSDGYKNVVRQASGEFVDKLAKEGKSDEFINGFRSGYESERLMVADIHCSR